MSEIVWKEGRGNRPIVGGRRVELYRSASLFIQRTPDDGWEQIDPVDAIDTSGLDIKVRYRPDYWEHLVIAQSYAGWSDEELQKNWSAFSSYTIWNFFDVSDVAIAFHAVTALMLLVGLGEMAWEQVK